MTLIVVHGAESTGKTTLGRRLAAVLGASFLPEFGRTWCEIFGTDCTASDLVEIGDYQQRNIAEALADRPLVVSDTDSLTTAAWAEMMLGTMPLELVGAPKADLYLHCAIDVPFVDDGLRIFGEPADRQRFDAIARRVLDDAHVPVVEVSGDWDERFAIACAAAEDVIKGGKQYLRNR